MSKIQPFRGLRPVPEKAAVVASPPYDVLSSDEARELVKNNPDSFLRVNKSEVDFPPDTDLYGDEVYKRGKDNLQRLWDEGIMARDAEPALYLYRLTWQGCSQSGLVTLSSCEEYNQGKIKKHEHTRPEKVNDRATHIQTLEAQVGPVFLIFRNNEETQGIFEDIRRAKPEVDFTADDGVRHELWVIVDNETVGRLVLAFGQMDATYVADGHHRAASASEVARRLAEKNPKHNGDELYNYFLTVIFPDNELRILPYNRVVADLNGLSLEDLKTKVSEKVEIAPSDKAVEPSAPYEFGMYCDGQWFALKAKDGTYAADDPARSIDSAVLSENLLTPILGIEDIRTDKRIDFVGGIRGVGELERLVDSRKYQVAFSLHAASIDQLLAVADADQVMPPKSTWFEPKLRSGMVVNLLTE